MLLVSKCNFFQTFTSVSYLNFFSFWLIIILFDCATDKFLESLLWTGVKGTVWPSHTYLITVVKDVKDGKIFNQRFENVPYKHAEEIMLDNIYFRNTVAGDRYIEIILTLNYSPCSKCAKKLQSFYESHKKKITKFIIQFSYLYYIQKEENQNGLRNLNEAGVTLQAMNPDSWDEVGIDLNVMKAKDRKRITERDKNTADELYRVLFPYKKEQVQDTSVDELSSRFNKQMKF